MPRNVKIKCPHCHKTARILRRFHNVDCTVAVIEESTGFAGLDWIDINVDIDSEAPPSRYVCEECGYVLFHDICEIDKYIREEAEKN